ncbi:hypothetical protein CANCADRAFT_27297 [Tortispora caseinolytica NRRL Y-17796]|uniref:Transcription factor CBF/NF-Y/archaeal histone domain-containing protein n=1 Tax=Tortispora caseinolytica NRRL Y-17796 TaxID=767744 RepID=A0A1E4TDT1_9ASCO|nr:hypothetical protein CANCADRAFT_27297 [Tortispora caseinolytica NRRL Y-17796]
MSRKEAKTKFPVARIKKIMQADDEIGKVAQVAPMLVSKSLELFMISLVQASVDQAQEKGHRKVLPGHVKLAVENNEQFDFLADVMEKYPNIAD